MVSELVRATTKGLKWTSALSITSTGIQFITSLVLTRYLVPEVFGVVAVLNSFLVFSQLIVESGMGTSIIQQSDLDQKDISTVFYFNIIISLFLSTIFCVSAGFIENYLEINYLSNYIYLYSILLIVIALSIVPRSLLAKDMNFKRIAVINIIATLSSSLFAIYGALNGFGIWSILIQHSSLIVISSALFLSSSGNYFRYSFSFESIRKLGPFGLKLTAAQLLNASTQSIVNVILAKIFSVRTLGIYDRSFKYSSYPGSIIKSVTSSVFLPMFSKAKSNHSTMRNYYIKIVNLLYVYIPPLTLLFFVCFQIITVKFFGEKWMGLVPIFNILLLNFIFTPLHTLNLTLIKSLGMGNQIVFIEVIKKILLIPIIASALLFGIYGLALAQVTTMFFEYLITSGYVHSKLRLGWFTQISVIITNMLPISVLVLIFSFHNRFSTGIGDLLKLLLVGFFLHAVFLILVKKQLLMESFSYLKMVFMKG